MHFSDVECGKRLFLGTGRPIALGIGEDEIRGSAYLEGPVQIGTADAYSSVVATTMIGRDKNTDEKSNPDRSLYVRGNTFMEGDSGTRNALYVTGGSGPNSVYIDGDLYVTGATDTGNKGRLASRFAAADASPKPFDIKHPSKKEWRLRYACIEGPEVGVYYRGRLKNDNEIVLPNYWKDLVHVDSITVQLQPIGAHQDIIVKRWDEEKIYLQAKAGFPINCFYHVYAERKDINPLIVEYKGDSWKDYPDPNFNPDTAPDPEDPNRFNDPDYRSNRNTITT
tara:strand:+ start:43 stop:885 length:843 start_codon:yes stop_codon:yes gene_type:complete